MKDALASSSTSAFTSFVDLATSVLILGFGGWTAINHPEELTAGSLLKFQLYWAMIDGAWRNLNGVVNTLTISAAAANRVLSLMDSLPDISLDDGVLYTSGTAEHHTPPVIEFRGVSFYYPSRPETAVLKNVSFIIPKGSITGIVGASGGGKSTIANLLIRLYDASAGDVLIDARNIKEWNLRSLHENLGYVSQDTQLFGSSVLANIVYGLPADKRKALTVEMIVDATRKANIYEEIMGFEAGFDTKIGEKGVRLSGGQRQRISIARAFLRKPSFLLLDEATSSLDSQNEALVQSSIDLLLKEIQGGSTVVCISHRLSTIVNANQIFCLNHGELVEVGTHSELLNKNGVYAKLFQTQLISTTTSKANE